MIFRASLCAVLMAGMFAIATEPVDAFYDDTHYAFTFYMARQCGYTPLQAHRLASANVRVDDSVATEPVQKLLSITSPTEAQMPRVAFHAFRDAREFGRGDEALANAAIHEQELALWLSATSMRNPGVLLHFIQDEPSHAGYASLGGHWLSAGAGAESLLRGNALDVSLAALEPLADLSLPMGATTDFLSYRPEQTTRMVDKTLSVLKDFMAAMSPRQRLTNCTEGAMRAVKQSLMKANFVTPQLFQYVGQLAAVNVATPRLGDAHLVVGAALSAAGALPQYQYRTERIPYELGPSGQPTGVSPDDFTLYGTLTTRLTGAGASGGPVQVSVWAKPTRTREKLYQLNCSEVTGPGAGGGPILPGLLDNLPVGDLLVRAVTSKGKVIEQSVALTQLDQEVSLDIPADEPEKATKCGEKVAERAKNMCTAVPGGGLLSKFQPNDDKKFEDGFEEELKKSKDCEEKEEQEEDEQAKREEQQNSQPGKGISSGKVAGSVAALGGVAIGTVYALKKLEEYTAASTPTPTPTTSTPSGGGTGGGGGSTGSTTFVSSSGITCVGRGNGPVQGTCTGQITVRVGQSLPSGTVVWLMAQAQAFLFGSATPSTPGQTTITVQGQIQMFDFNDNITCPRSVTQVVVTRDSRQGASLGNLSVTIPVTCRRG